MECVRTDGPCSVLGIISRIDDVASNKIIILKHGE